MFCRKILGAEIFLLMKSLIPSAEILIAGKLAASAEWLKYLKQQARP
ncbi:MAG: hypothetical protein RLY20_1407 [Verrucomicrobiota bacterium]